MGNGLLIAEYISIMKREINISLGYKKANILTLANLSKFHSDQKNFKEMAKDVVNYLDSLRRPEVSDPLHKWIGTYNPGCIGLSYNCTFGLIPE